MFRSEECCYTTSECVVLLLEVSPGVGVYSASAAVIASFRALNCCCHSNRFVFVCLTAVEGEKVSASLIQAAPFLYQCCRGHSPVCSGTGESFSLPERATRVRLRLFQDVIPPVRFWMRSFPVSL
jgi:hypothetical protein